MLVVDKREHIGGNCFDYVDKTSGFRVAEYGELASQSLRSDSLPAADAEFGRGWVVLSRRIFWCIFAISSTFPASSALLLSAPFLQARTSSTLSRSACGTT